MLISCDASQLEWRTIVELSRDQTALKEILNGEDTHSLNQKAFLLPSRLVAKKYLFRTIFRGSGYSFSIDPDFIHVSNSPAYWDNVNELFYKKYEGVDKQHTKWKDELAETGRITGPLGRFWTMPLINKWGKLNWTQLTNFPVQGTGADIMTLARVSFQTRLKKHNLEKEVLLISSVHDSIVADSPSQYLEPVTKLFHEVFRDLQLNIKKLFNYEWTTPLACEVKAGPNMKDMKLVTL